MEKEEENNNQWKSTLSFLMAMIGSAIGLGNIWRYPYVVYSNGGGAFLLPYLISIIFMALPYLYLEYGVGYEFKSAVPEMFKKVKGKLEVIGWFICFTSFLILTYYVVVIGWDLIYLLLSFTKGWGTNPNAFYTAGVLHSTTSLAGITSIVWPIAISLVVIWFIIWYISHQNLNNGIGKYSQILIPSLIIMMAIVVFYGLSLPGASIGYSALFTPNWSALTNPKIWLAAAGQILFSLSLGWGVASTYTSYLPEDTNLIKNGIIVTIANCGFELFAAIGIFSILGFMSLNQGQALNNLVTQGSGLIFVALPTIFNVMGNFAYILGPIFFLCVFFAGITTTISLLEPISYGISNKFGIKREKIVTILCIIGFTISIIYATRTGSYLLTITDSFLNEFAVLFGIILECLTFGWLYNTNKILAIINKNYSKYNLGIWWTYLIKYLIPLIFICLWADGVYGLITSNNFISALVEGLLAIVLIVCPIIVTILPEKKTNMQ